jgi:hypothetical protein
LVEVVVIVDFKMGAEVMVGRAVAGQNVVRDVMISVVTAPGWQVMPGAHDVIV